MGTVPVVVMKPGRKLGIAVLGIGIVASVSPFPQGGLDETLGFAVGARGVGPGETVMETQLGASGSKSMRAVAVAIIGEQTTDANAQAGVIEERGAEKGQS